MLARPSRRPLAPALSPAAWLALAGGGLLLAAGLALSTVHLLGAEQPRCYWLKPPLTSVERALLSSSFVDCIFDTCRVTVSSTSVTGWVCFARRPGRR
jgi:hypothetical protein